MEIEIYADVVFFINFAMDIIIFMIAGKLSSVKSSNFRIALGSFVSAALYCVLALAPFFRSYYNFPASLVILLVGLIIAFNPKKISTALKLVIFANVAAFSIGGAVFAFFYYSNLGGLISNALSYSVGNISLKILLAATTTSYIIIKILTDRLNKSTEKKQRFYTINILLDTKEISAKALLDTGNSLCDPLTSEPVIIAEFAVIKDFLPPEIKTIYYESRDDQLLELMNAFSKTTLINRIRILPFSSLGKKNGMLIGFKPDYIRIMNMDGAGASDFVSKEVVIGISNFSLSNDGSFQALLNPSLLSHSMEC